MSTTRRERWTAAVVVMAVVMLVAGCSSTTNSTTDGTSRSSTPRITLGSVPAGLAHKTLTQADLDAVPGLEQAQLSSINGADVYADPDTKGPCGLGQPIDPTGSDTNAVAIRATDLEGFEFVADLGSPAAADAAVAKAKASFQPHCYPYSAKTNTGGTQTMADPQPVALHAGDVSTGLQIQVSSAGQTQVVDSAVVAAGSDAFELVLFSASPRDTSVLTALTTKAAARLAG
jgi:hypothetical protein